MFSSRKYPYFPHGRDWKFLGGWRFPKTKKFKEMDEVEWEFPEGRGELIKIPTVGEVWIFDGTTQSHFGIARTRIKTSQPKMYI